VDKHQIEAVLDVVEQEGFDYAFVEYSNFEDIENEEFHKIRKAYLEARDKLGKLIGYMEE